MASLMLKVTRGAARTARWVAYAASRYAAMLRGQGSDPADPLLRRSLNQPLVPISRSVVVPRPRFVNISIPDPAPVKVEFVATEADMASDEALWALYERWCKEFNEERQPEEMARRFSKFKETVLRVDRHNKANLPSKLEISKFADGKLAELVKPIPMRWF